MSTGVFWMDSGDFSSTFSSTFCTTSVTFSCLSEIKEEVDDLTESHNSEKFGIFGRDGNSRAGSSFLTEIVCFYCKLSFKNVFLKTK